MYLNSEAKIVIYGGAAGGGKSFCSLLHHIKHIGDPLYRGIIIRRTVPMLTKPGAIWDEAKTLYKQIEPRVKIRHRDMKFIFPSGAEVAFSGFEREDNKENFQGAQFSSVSFDELTQFTEGQFIYLISRLRTGADVQATIRATCNPGPDSFVRQWVDWWLYPEGHELFGRPDPEKQGKIRWFVRLNNEMYWADTREEAIRLYGKPDLPVDHQNQVKPLSVQFISATVYDNPVMLANNPDYISFLEGLPRVEQERLLHGNWEAREEASGFFKREWLGDELNLPPTDIVGRVRAWDIAGSKPSETNPNPDWTAGVLMSRDKFGTIYIEDVVRFQANHGEVLEKIIETARHDGLDTVISIPREPGQAGMQAARYFTTQITDCGYYVKSSPTNKSKVTRFAPFAAAAEAGSIRYVRGKWNKDYFSELERFDGSKNIKDDQVDATSDGFSLLASSLQIPHFLPPEMRGINPFKL